MKRGEKSGFGPPLTIVSNGTAGGTFVRDNRTGHRVPGVTRIDFDPIEAGAGFVTARGARAQAEGECGDMKDARDDVLLRLALYGATGVSVTKNARGEVLGVEAIPPERIVTLPDGSAGVRVDREPDGTLTFLSCPPCGGKGTLRATSTWKDGTVTREDEPCFRCKGKGRI